MINKWRFSDGQQSFHAAKTGADETGKAFEKGSEKDREAEQDQAIYSGSFSFFERPRMNARTLL
jgi:hypothetical protein